MGCCGRRWGEPVPEVSDTGEGEVGVGESGNLGLAQEFATVTAAMGLGMAGEVVGGGWLRAQPPLAALGAQPRVSRVSRADG
jgi:hypothetical protein